MMASYQTSGLPQLSESVLYDKLCRYILPVGQLQTYSYPLPDPEIPGQRKAPYGQRQQLRSQFASTYNCARCEQTYQVDTDGVPRVGSGRCTYHPGKVWVSLGLRHLCCKRAKYSTGCTSNDYHVHRAELELKNFEGYVRTEPKPEREPNMHGIFALDCEMSYTTYGLEVTRVTVLNHKLELVYESLVKPDNKILDYNTAFTGITESDMANVSTRLVEVQRRLLDMFSSKSILIGHGLDHDMKALKIFHERFIDTAQLFSHPKGLPYKRALVKLAEEFLKVKIQQSASHDSKEDAIAALRLVMWKLERDS